LRTGDAAAALARAKMRVEANCRLDIEKRLGLKVEIAESKQGDGRDD
jgi:hypothetical protein